MTTITRYEITARHPDGRAYLIGYTPRLSRPGLAAAMRKVGEAMVARMQIGEYEAIAWGMRPRIHCTIGAWTIGFTGRTQLDARSAPLPYIAGKD